MHIQNVYRNLWLLVVFEFFLAISASPRRYPLLVPSLGLLDLFIQQCWCANLLTILRKAWLYENPYYANLCHSLINLQSKFLLPQFLIWFIIFLPLLHLHCVHWSELRSREFDFNIVLCSFGAVFVIDICTV
jgi:hypothetical protein